MKLNHELEQLLMQLVLEHGISAWTDLIPKQKDEIFIIILSDDELCPLVLDRLDTKNLLIDWYMRHYRRHSLSDLVDEELNEWCFENLNSHIKRLFIEIQEPI